MYCEVHKAVGDAVPWMRKQDYKDCMICATPERLKIDKQSRSQFQRGIESAVDDKVFSVHQSESALQPTIPDDV